MPEQKSLQQIFQNYQTLIVVGGNWGDEGKGKVIDLIMGGYDVVARFSGGANAGHTVYTADEKKLVSHLIPCGLAQNKVCVLGRGEFFNLELFLKELEEAKEVLLSDDPHPSASGGHPLPSPYAKASGDKKGEGKKEGLAPIYIDQQAPLWTPYHRLFEMYIEIMRGERKIGTTNKGIGPLEGMYKLRLAPVVGYLFEKDLLIKSLQALYNVLKPCLESIKDQINETIPEPQEILEKLLSDAEKIKSFIADTSFLLDKELKSGKRILFEGAQATGLDAWWGTYPFVSSGNSVATGASLGTGLPMENFGATIMVAKTLPTRVGFGPFPSEMWERQAAMDFAKEHLDLFSAGKARDEFLSSALQKINSGESSAAEMSQYFQVLGDERGATTGRGRSVGFLDIPWLQYAIRINGPKYMALTRLDMLSGLKSIPVVVGYKHRGQLLPAGKLPAAWELSQVETVKEDWPCFLEKIDGINDESKLPKSAQAFLSRLEKHLGVPILLVGTGPGREAMVVRN